MHPVFPVWTARLKRRSSEYMQTDEYIEKTAREKLGMVKDNEILFKESQSK